MGAGPDQAAVAEAYKEALLRLFGPELVSVVLFGSAARRESSAGSDIDLLVVAEGLPSSRRDRHRLLFEVEDQLESSGLCGPIGGFSVLLKLPAEAARTSPIYLDMVEDGVLLFDRDGFFRQVLARLEERLERYGAERIRRGKVRYWRLKKDYKWGDVISFDE